MRIIGIDPGSSGGMAALIEGQQAPEVFKLDNTERDIAHWLDAQMRDELEHGDGVLFAYLELVGPNRIAAKGERKQGASTMFTFGQNYGFLRGVLIAASIPFEEVRAAKWCQSFGLKRAESETDSEWKNRHKAKAQQFWPMLKITHYNADALLIAEHGRRLRIGQLTTNG